MVISCTNEFVAQQLQRKTLSTSSETNGANKISLINKASNSTLFSNNIKAKNNKDSYLLQIKNESRYVRVVGIPENTSDKKIITFFESYGSVQEVTHENGDIIVAFNNLASAREAYKSTLKMDGNCLKIHYHTSRIPKLYITIIILNFFLRDPLAISSESSSADNTPVKNVDKKRIIEEKETKKNNGKISLRSSSVSSSSTDSESTKIKIPYNQRKVLRKRASLVEPEATQISSEVDSESNNGSVERPSTSVNNMNNKIKPASQLATGMISTNFIYFKKIQKINHALVFMVFMSTNYLRLL